jgi:hypothetical protein
MHRKSMQVISLYNYPISTKKNLLSFLLLLILSNKIRDKGKIVSSWCEGVRERMGW